MSNIFDFPGSKSDAKVSASQALREFADLIEEFEISYGDIEVAGVALIPEIGVALCGNSETGNDGLNTMLDIGKTAIIMQYVNEGDYDDTIH